MKRLRSALHTKYNWKHFLVVQKNRVVISSCFWYGDIKAYFPEYIREKGFEMKEKMHFCKIEQVKSWFCVWGFKGKHISFMGSPSLLRTVKTFIFQARKSRTDNIYRHRRENVP